MIIDSHQHYWRLARGDYGWLTRKLGPIYHLFSSMAAGVWGGSQFARFAVAGEVKRSVCRLMAGVSSSPTAHKIRSR